jgi:glycosyltransferase involved in cell wall biosynthesis
MKGPPLISFITPTFNSEKLVADTLDSLLAQTNPRWENVIVDDGSTDATVNIIQSYSAPDSRFRFFRREREPKGACTCRNIGVEKAQAKYIVFLDSDDIAAPHCTEQRARTMAAYPNLDFGVFQALQFEDKPGDLGLWWNIDKPHSDELTRQFLQDALCQGSGPAFKKDSIIRAGLWDETLTIWQDIDLFFRLYIQKYDYKKFFDLPADIHLRRFPHSLSRSNFFARHKLESRFRVIQSAVSLLNETNQHMRVREARHMAAETISGCARSHNDDLASEMLFWAESHGVLNATEFLILKQYCRASKLRLTRLPPVDHWFENKMRWCSATGPNTLGRIPVSQPSIAVDA